MLELFLEPVIILEIVLVAIIIVFQVWSFLSNKARMNDYLDIFSEEEAWDVDRDDFGNVSCIKGGGENSFFLQIKHTINRYISSSSNAVADYQILKEAVDRHCETIEDEIESQTPVPLYLGLAGTMIGVILGLFVFIKSGAITDLSYTNNLPKTEKSNDLEFQRAADGINSLLLGVAIAMCASFCGIGLTTYTTYHYKNIKQDAERKQNNFMSWMQSVLLPELPNDISGAMAQLVEDLEDFNKKFEQNTSSLSRTFENVNEAYKTQADIVKAVRDMDVQKMAAANVSVLKQLEKSTEKLERFNQYLDRIEGYTSTIQKFNEQFQQEESQLGLLKKIYDFFNQELYEIDQRKAALSDAVSSVDKHLKDAVESLQLSFEEQLDTFRESLLNQTETFTNMMQEQKKSFSDYNGKISQSLEDELKQYPETLKQLKLISEIPGELKNLSSSFKNEIGHLISELPHSLSKGGEYASVHASNSRPFFSKKARVLAVLFCTFIAACALISTIFCGIVAFKAQPLLPNTESIESNDIENIDSIAADTLEAAIFNVSRERICML